MAAVSFDRDVRPRHSGAGAGALGMHGASRKIDKPAPAPAQQQRKPVIIYMVSPKVIHVEPDEFMSLVQRLTGPDSGRGRERASSTAGGSASGAGNGKHGSAERAAPLVRVKARALYRPGPAVSVSVTAAASGHHQDQTAGAAAPPSWSGPSPSSSGFLFHDLSPLRGGALKGESPWLHHVGDHFLSPGAPSFGLPSAAFLDIFGPLSSQHQ